MHKLHVLQTRVPGARRRIDPETLVSMYDDKGVPLWSMPAPISYMEHKKWCKHKRTGQRIAEPIMVPIYRGTSAAFARWVKAQLRRNQRKAAEAQAEADAEENSLQEIGDKLTDLILDSGGNNVEA